LISVLELSAVPLSSAQFRHSTANSNSHA